MSLLPLTPYPHNWDVSSTLLITGQYLIFGLCLNLFPCSKPLIRGMLQNRIQIEGYQIPQKKRNVH